MKPYYADNPDTLLRAALRDANTIIRMTREHLAEAHPECAYTVLGIMNDGSRDALVETDRSGLSSRTRTRVNPPPPPPELDPADECECGHSEADHYWTCGVCQHVPPYESEPDAHPDAHPDAAWDAAWDAVRAAYGRAWA